MISYRTDTRVFSVEYEAFCRMLRHDSQQLCGCIDFTKSIELITHDIEKYGMCWSNRSNEMDCMGFVERHRREAREAGLPVILSNSLIAKLVSEIT